MEPLQAISRGDFSTPSSLHAGAVLNYLYAILEAEARLAASELGLDPGLGVLHRDTPNRDASPTI